MNILIVDDEPLIHTSIAYTLRELFGDKNTILDAYSGAEMIRQLSAASVDLALVDIRMPGLDGLQAIESCRKQYPNTSYYIMSGYSEFEYAREAVRLGVVEYLLKPIEADKLKQIVETAAEKVELRKAASVDTMRSWLIGALNGQNVSRLFGQNIHAALLFVLFDGEEISDFALRLQTIPGNCGSDMVSVPCGEGVLAMIFAEHRSSVYRALKEIGQTDVPETATLFISSVFDQAEELKRQAVEIVSLAPLRVFQGTGRIHDSVVVNQLSRELVELSAKYVALKNAFLTGEYSRFNSISENIAASRECFRLTGAQWENCISFIESFSGVSIPTPTKEEELRSSLRSVAAVLLTGKKGPDRIDTILSYIKDNYDQDLSLTGIADRFHITPNYLSSLIKKRLGCKFTEYLNSLRIAKAKELLLTEELSVRGVAEAVGYYSQSYFNKVFAEYEGCTPSEFKARK